MKLCYDAIWCSLLVSCNSQRASISCDLCASIHRLFYCEHMLCTASSRLLCIAVCSIGSKNVFMQCKRNSLTVSSMSFLLSRLTHINEAQNTYRLHHYELQEEEEEGFHTLPPFIFSPLWEIFERLHLSLIWVLIGQINMFHIQYICIILIRPQVNTSCMLSAMHYGRKEIVPCVSVSFVCCVILHMQCCGGGWWICTGFHTVKYCIVLVYWPRLQRVAGWQ